MKLTSAMKAYAEKNLGVKAGSAAGVYFRAISKAVEGGKLTALQARALMDGKKAAGKQKAPAKAGTSLRQELAGAFQGLTESIKEAFKKEPATPPAPADKRTKEQKSIDARLDARLKEMGLVGAEGRPTPTSVLGGAAAYLKADGIRVKSATEHYKKDRQAALYPTRSGKAGAGCAHPLAGCPAVWNDRPLTHGSELDKAISGAYLKFSLEASAGLKEIPRNLRMTDHDRDLMQYALHEEKWTGLLHGVGSEDCGAIAVNNRRLTALEQKALLDDTVSGGIEAAPIVFDDLVILTPVLYGELFPFVNVINITRGRRIEGFSMGNPSFISGTAEGAAIQPFNTAQFIQAFDTTIFVATAAMEIGLDLEEDSPADIGGIVAERFGLKFLELMDYDVAVGDGVTQPQGIFNAPSTTLVSSDNGPAGPPTVSDYEGLMFGVAKAFRKEPGAMTCFVGNDTTYRRARGIPVGPTDERRVFGMDQLSYTLFDHPFKVQNDIPNGDAAFVNLKRYRLYRRLGLQTAISTEGQYLKTRNLKLLVMRARMGGQLEIGGAMSLISDGQS